VIDSVGAVMNRRSFLCHTFAASAAFGPARVLSAQTGASPASPGLGNEPKRGAAFDIPRVKEFVGAGHGNLARVQAMLADEPKLVLASYDWGAGDFETALGGAAHTGRREIALHLLEAGARIDAFAAAMLGELDIVNALVRFSPATASTRGPHGYSLLYHAGYSGRIEIAEAIAIRLSARGPHCNQALQTATARGHTELVAWLLKNGADNVNTKNFAGKTPLDVALANGHTAIIDLLRGAGGLTTL
jgi:hypothetical protein